METVPRKLGRILASFMIVTLFATSAYFSTRQSLPIAMEYEDEHEALDNDWFMLQRTYPLDDLDLTLYAKAKRDIQQKAGEQTLARSVAWQSVGPANIGGRITSLALDPTNSSIIYAGAAAGGVWKSSNNGTTWKNIFNESSSIGSLQLDPTNPMILYVGSGEANPAGVAVYPGNGIWRSTDGGQTWTNLGLGGTGHIGKLGIHPAAPSRIFAAALGRYRSRTQERGIYRSTDNGSSWQRVLFLNDTTGACDVLIDPVNPQRVYAAMWNRYRPLTYSVIAGRNSGLWLSTNAGDTWTQVTNGFPANDPTLGRIGLAVSASQPSMVYALAAEGTGARGVYKSTDSGFTWTLLASSSAFNSEFQVWFNNIIAVDPTNPDVLWCGMTPMYSSINGGATWANVTSSLHVDQHAIEFDRNNSSRIVVGNDGGVFISTNAGLSWIKSYNLPVSQFYAGTIDFTNPQRYYGGMQDNGTARTLTGSPDDWQEIFGGDGFYVLVDPTNPNRIYAEFQNGGLAYSADGGATFNNGRSGISATDRKNWSTPFVMDPNSTLTLYTGTHRAYKTTNGMQGWTVISGDLTRGQNGRIGTITTIDVARSDPRVIYVGTDDGKVSVTTDGGTSWNDVTGTLPMRWVTRVAIDPDSANVAYVTHSGYLEDQFASHIHKTYDFGQMWISIGNGLPDMPLNDVIVDPDARPYLYIATDVGVMYSSNQGTTWQVLGTGFPEVPVHDLTLHSPTRKLLAFTHGRSVYSIDLSTLTSIRIVAHSVPHDFILHQNYPNPFNPSTTIRFDVPHTSHVDLSVFDVAGREVASLINEALKPGSYEVSWNVDTFAPNSPGLGSGVYFCRLKAGSMALTRKMVFIK